MNSQGRQPLELQQTHARALQGRNILSVILSPLRGLNILILILQGLAPLAIDCRPSRGSTNFCGIVYANRDENA